MRGSNFTEILQKPLYFQSASVHQPSSAAEGAVSILVIQSKCSLFLHPLHQHFLAQGNVVQTS